MKLHPTPSHCKLHRAIIILGVFFTHLTPSLQLDDFRFTTPTQQITFQSQPTSKDDPMASSSAPGTLVAIDRLDPSLLNRYDQLTLDRLERHIQSYPDQRLIRWADGHQQWITEGQKALFILQEGRRKFVDITDSSPSDPGFILDSDPQQLNPSFVSSSDAPHRLISDSTHGSFPEKIHYGSHQVTNYTQAIQTSRMRSRLIEFTNFKTRYYRSRSGQQSQAWLLNEIKTLVAKSGLNVTVREFEHEWGQNSIIARFEPDPRSTITDLNNSSTFIIGAHQDSTNLLPFLPAPGADDDGSGTMSILEAFNVLLDHHWSPQPNRGALEFMWYSAEEGGLLGSQQIAKSYRSLRRSVSGMVQFDMTAFVKKGTQPAIGLVTDFVDPSLTQFLRILIDEYLSIGWTNTKCGYACSDHASWININVPSAFAIESKFEDSNQKIHSLGDTIHQPEFSFDHMAEFSKLVLGLAFELKGL